jgi:hypothetical protein
LEGERVSKVQKTFEIGPTGLNGFDDDWLATRISAPVIIEVLEKLYQRNTDGNLVLPKFTITVKIESPGEYKALSPE